MEKGLIRQPIWLFTVIALALLACSTTIPSETNLEIPYRYDNLPDAGQEDAALADYRAISYWGKFDLAYYFINDTGKLPGDSERDLVRQAFEMWASQTDLTINETNDPDLADILIGWARGEHGDGDPFDGSGGILAHGSYPNPYEDRQVILHFDDAERWVDSASQDVDLLTVAAHEIGHNLGLDHSRVRDALMFAGYIGPHRFLAQDDIAGIQSLYGLTHEPAGEPEPPPDQPKAPPSENEDADQDGISDADEVLRTGTDPNDADSDGDGIDDGVEVIQRMNPLDPDMDRDGASDGAEVAAGSDPFFPDQKIDLSPELEQEISEFLTSVIELQIQAYRDGDASIADTVLAGDLLTQLEQDIFTLNQRGLIQISAIDYYESYISDIRLLNETRIEVDTCETWSSAIYRLSDGELVESDGPTLLPQTITLELLGQAWFVTEVDFHEVPAFCN